MNKIFKIVWNRTRACYMVVCEYAKSRGKGCSTARLWSSRNMVAATAAVGFVAALSFNAHAGAHQIDLMPGSANTVSGDNAIVWGSENISSGIESTAWGYGNLVSGEDSTVFGLYNEVEGDYSTAWGYTNHASGEVATAWGEHTSAAAEGSTAWGNITQANGDFSTAWGSTSKAFGAFSTAFGGGDTHAYGEASTAFGYGTKAYGDYSTAWGTWSEADGENATAFGEGTHARGQAATAWGIEDTQANGDYSTAWGGVSKAFGEYSTAFGKRSKAYGENSLAALGGQTGFNPHDESGMPIMIDVEYPEYWQEKCEGGENAVALGQAYDSEASESVMSYALGKNSVALIGGITGEYSEESWGVNYLGGGVNAFAVGIKSNAVGENSIAMGNESWAFGDNSTAIGGANTGRSEYDDATGKYIYSDGEYAFAAGAYSTAEANYSTAIGYGSTASADYSTAIGYYSEAYGEYSIAMLGAITGIEGEDPYDYGYDSFGVGYGAEAIGNYTIAIGEYAKAEADNSVAMGYYAEANGENSLALGSEARATLDNSVALGSGSVAKTEAGAVGYLYNEFGKDSGAPEYVWKATKAAVAVGDPENEITRQITGVAAGTEDTDAVNVAQLKAVRTTVTSKDKSVAIEISINEGGGTNYDLAVKGSLSYTANGEETSSSSVALEKGLNFTNGKNTTASVDVDGVVKYDLNDDISLTSVTTGDTVMNTNGLTIKNGPSVTLNGIDAGNKKIINVAAGVDSTDAVNVSQLQTSVAGAKTEVKAGANVSSVDYSAAEDGHAIYTVNVDNMRVTDGSVSYDDKGNGTLTVISGEGASKTETQIKGLKDTITNLDKVETSLEGDSKLKVSVTTKEDGQLNTKDSSVDLSGLKTKQGDKNTEDIAELQNIVEKNNYQINRLDNKINKVGAHAAALAGLHPLDFDPDDKLHFAAGYGHYKGENAGAIGAFYRPDEKVMFSVAGTTGGGEHMVNAGLTFSLDRTPRQTRSKTAMARDIMDLRDIVMKQQEQISRLNSLVVRLTGHPEESRDIFPDVPENHWAYEYIKGLCEDGVLVGYPDGTFSGDRQMTRYEFAAMLYRALQSGVVISDRAAKEFAPELGRFRVDRIHGADDSNHKIERIRVNGDHDYGRDNYGSKNPQPVTSRGPQYPEAEKIVK